MNRNISNVTIRPLEDSDFKEVHNLKLKERDILELQKMSDVLVKDYMLWHTAYNKEITNVLVYKNKIIGIIGITDEGTLFFTTSDIDKRLSFLLVKYFNVVLDELLTERNLETCYTYIDNNYEVAKRWATVKGFESKKVISINNNLFNVMKYTKS